MVSRDPQTKLHHILGISVDWPQTHNAAKFRCAPAKRVPDIRFRKFLTRIRRKKLDHNSPKSLTTCYGPITSSCQISTRSVKRPTRKENVTKIFYPLLNFGIQWDSSLQWRAPNGVLLCWWYVAREHDHWPSSKMHGYRCLPTVHWHQSPSVRWYAGTLKVSSSLLVVGIRIDSPVMILPGIWTCHMAKEAEPSCFNDTWSWRAASSLPDRSVGKVWSLRDVKDFSDRACVKGIQSPSKSFCDSPCFRSIFQHWEDIGLTSGYAVVHGRGVQSASLIMTSLMTS